MVEEVAEKTNKWHETMQMTKAEELRTSANRKKAAEITEKALDVERQNSRLQEKYRHLQAQGETKQRAAEEANNEGRARLLALQRKRRDVDNKISDETRAAEVGLGVKRKKVLQRDVERVAVYEGRGREEGVKM